MLLIIVILCIANAMGYMDEIETKIVPRPAQMPTEAILEATEWTAPTAPEPESKPGFVAPTAPEPESEPGFVAPTAPEPEAPAEPVPVPLITLAPTPATTARPTPIPTINSGPEKYSVQYFVDLTLHSYAFYFAVFVSIFVCSLFIYLRCYHKRSFQHPDEKAAYSQLSVFDADDDAELDDVELNEMK